MKKVFLALACAFLVWGGQEVMAEKNLLPLAEDNYDPAIVDNFISFPVKWASQSERSGTESSLVTIFRNYSAGNGILIQKVNMVLGAIAIFYLVLLGAKFVMARGEEEKISKYKDYFGWMIVGLAIISVAEFMAFGIFDPVADDILGDAYYTEEFTNKVHQIKLFIQILIGGVMLIKMMMSGYDLVTGSESDESIQQEKGFLKSFFLGTGLILMAEVLTRILSATLGDPTGTALINVGGAGESDGAATAAAAERGISEIVGIVNFSLTFVGIVAVLMLILSSLYYVISFGSDDQMGRAKKMIFSSLFGIVVIVSSFVLIRFMVR